MEIKNLSHKEKQSLWYPAISCVQKAVRRSLFKYARVPAIIAYRVNPSRFKMRCFTILGEDCARDYMLVKMFHENVHEAFKTEEGMLKIVKHMCERYKSREIPMLNFGARCKADEPFEVAHRIKAYLGELAQMPELSRMMGYEAVLSRFQDFGYSVPQWMEEFLIESIAKKWDREEQAFYMPMLYSMVML